MLTIVGLKDRLTLVVRLKAPAIEVAMILPKADRTLRR